MTIKQRFRAIGFLTLLLALAGAALFVATSSGTPEVMAQSSSCQVGFDHDHGEWQPTLVMMEGHSVPHYKIPIKVTGNCAGIGKVPVEIHKDAQKLAGDLYFYRNSSWPDRGDVWTGQINDAKSSVKTGFIYLKLYDDPWFEPDKTYNAKLKLGISHDRAGKSTAVYKDGNDPPAGVSINTNRDDITLKVIDNDRNNIRIVSYRRVYLDWPVPEDFKMHIIWQKEGAPRPYLMSWDDGILGSDPILPEGRNAYFSGATVRDLQGTAAKGDDTVVTDLDVKDLTQIQGIILEDASGRIDSEFPCAVSVPPGTDARDPKVFNIGFRDCRLGDTREVTVTTITEDCVAQVRRPAYTPHPRDATDTSNQPPLEIRDKAGDSKDCGVDTLAPGLSYVGQGVGDALDSTNCTALGLCHGVNNPLYAGILIMVADKWYDMPRYQTTETMELRSWNGHRTSKSVRRLDALPGTLEPKPLNSDLTSISSAGVMYFASSASSVAEDVGTHKVRINFQPPLEKPAKLSMMMSPGTASWSEDYRIGSGQSIGFTAPKGAASFDIPITIYDDNEVETVETMTLTVSPIHGYRLGDSPIHTVTIVDNDSAGDEDENTPSGSLSPQTPVVSVSAGPGVTEGSKAKFTLTASPAPAGNLSVLIAVSQQGDYGRGTAEFSVTIPTSGTLALPLVTIDDNVDEPDGSITITVKADSGYTVSTTKGAATVDVSDNDAPASVCAVTPTSDALVALVRGYHDGNKGRPDYNQNWFRALIAFGAETSNTLQPFTVADARAEEQVWDGWKPVREELERLERETAACASATPTPTSTPTPTATPTPTSTPTPTATPTPTSTPTPTATPTPTPTPTPVVSVSGGSGVTEGGSATFTLTANPAPAASLTVNVSVAQSGDYGVTTGSKTVTIPTGGSATLSVATAGDSVDEDDGSVTVSVSGGTGYTVGSTSAATVSVSDDDDPPVSDFVPDADLVTNVRSYVAETQGGAAHVNRWKQVLVALGVESYPGISPMTSTEAQKYADKGWTRWTPVAAELKKAEAARD